jgi:hypothetical protein
MQMLNLFVLFCTSKQLAVTLLLESVLDQNYYSRLPLPLRFRSWFWSITLTRWAWNSLGHLWVFPRCRKGLSANAQFLGNKEPDLSICIACTVMDSSLGLLWNGWLRLCRWSLVQEGLLGWNWPGKHVYLRLRLVCRLRLLTVYRPIADAKFRDS